MMRAFFVTKVFSERPIMLDDVSRMLGCPREQASSSVRQMPVRLQEARNHHYPERACEIPEDTSMLRSFRP
jgi:hypothetical protein